MRLDANRAQRDKIAVVYLGHSHLAFMIPFLNNRAAEDCSVTNEIKHYVFNVYSHNVCSLGEDRFYYGIPGSKPHLNPRIVEMVSEKIETGSRIVYVSLFGGNSHNALMLLSSQRKFDFILPSEPGLPLFADRELIPFGAIQEILAKNMAMYLDDLRALRSSVDGEVFHVISPPPIANDVEVSKIVANDPYFAQMNNCEVTPAIIRYKAWRAHTEIFENLCAEIGVCVLSPPGEALLDGRWLSSAYIGSDPTHANLSYGGLVFQQMEQALGGQFAGWDWVG